MKIITPDEMAHLPLREYTGSIRLVASDQDLARAIRVIRGEKVVGLDTETRPAFRKGQFYLPCLVQIATASAVYLFHLKRMDFSRELVETLENAALIKAGIGLNEDITKLKKIFSFEPQNLVDLSLVAQRKGFTQSSVRSLAGQLLRFRVSKSSSTSNWAKPQLTSKQIAYAATDAWVCRELFLRFQQLGFIDQEGRNPEAAHTV
jgi:ribonuclease D